MNIQDGYFKTLEKHKECNYCNQTTDIWGDMGLYVGCISLKENTHRRKEVEKELHRVGLCRNSGFWIVERHPKGGINGCYESHRALSAYFLNLKAKSAMILEEDVLFSGIKCETDIHYVKSKFKQVREHNPDWYMFYLGWMPIMSLDSLIALYKEPMRNILQGQFMNMHAYMINERGMKYLYDRPFRNRPVDRDMNVNERNKCYAIYPMIAFQPKSAESTVHKIEIYSIVNKVWLQLFLANIAKTIGLNTIQVIIVGIVLCILVIICVLFIFWKCL